MLSVVCDSVHGVKGGGGGQVVRGGRRGAGVAVRGLGGAWSGGGVRSGRSSGSCSRGSWVRGFWWFMVWGWVRVLRWYMSGTGGGWGWVSWFMVWGSEVRSRGLVIHGLRVVPGISGSPWFGQWGQVVYGLRSWVRWFMVHWGGSGQGVQVVHGLGVRWTPTMWNRNGARCIIIKTNKTLFEIYSVSWYLLTCLLPFVSFHQFLFEFQCLSTFLFLLLLRTSPELPVLAWMYIESIYRLII